jgi:hypothetical protein
MNSIGVTFRSPYGSLFQILVPVSWFSIQANYYSDFTQTRFSFETRNLLLKCLDIIAHLFALRAVSPQQAGGVLARLSITIRERGTLC